MHVNVLDLNEMEQMVFVCTLFRGSLTEICVWPSIMLLNLTTFFLTKDRGETQTWRETLMSDLEPITAPAGMQTTHGLI